jgi:ribosome-associated protein
MTDTISRSEQKRRLKRIEDTAAELADLTNNDLKVFPGSDEIKREILSIRDLKGGARKRQIKHLAKIMREDSLDAVYDFLQQRKGSQQKSIQLEHEAEHLRDAIINEAMADQERCRQQQRDWEPGWPSPVIEAARRQYPGFDEVGARNAAHQYVRSRNRTYYRELYRIAKAALEQDEIRRRMA